MIQAYLQVVGRRLPKVDATAKATGPSHSTTLISRTSGASG